MNLIELSKLAKRIRKYVNKWRVNKDAELLDDIEELLLDYIKGQCSAYRITLTPETIDDYCNKIVDKILPEVLKANSHIEIERICLSNINCECGRNDAPVRVHKGFPICNYCYDGMITINWWDLY